MATPPGKQPAGRQRLDSPGIAPLEFAAAMPINPYNKALSPRLLRGEGRTALNRGEDEKVATYEVTFLTEERHLTVAVADNEYLLNAGAEAGLELPYMCLQGWCTTCAARVLEGQVDQSEARRIYPQDEAAGFVLLCSAFPRSNLRLLTHQKEAMRAHRRELGLPAPRG